MDGELSERLLHNLAYSQAMIVYNGKQSLQHHLHIFNEAYNLAFIKGNADLTINQLRSLFVSQLFGNPLHNPELTLIELFSEFDKHSNTYLIIVKELYSAEFLSDLIALNQLFAERISIILELPAQKAGEAIAKIEAAGRTVVLIGTAETQVKKENFADYLPQKKQPVSSLVKYSLFTVCSILAIAGYFMLINTENAFFTPQVKKNNARVLEPLSSPEEAKLMTATLTVTDVASTDSTAENTTTITEASPTDTGTAARISEINENTVLRSVSGTDLALSAEKSTVVDERSHEIAPTITSKEAVATVVLNNNPVSPLSEVPLAIRDNDWFKQQNANQFVLQITLISDEGLLEDYLSDHKLNKQVKIYFANGRYGVVYGLYDSIQSAQSNLAKAPLVVQKSQAWVKSISAIQQQLEQETSSIE